jgi:hypothetical protein
MEKVIKIEHMPVKRLRESIEHQKDFYKSELLEMGYFKTPEGKQLYELSLRDLEYIYLKERARKKEN